MDSFIVQKPMPQMRIIRDFILWVFFWFLTHTLSTFFSKTVLLHESKPQQKICLAIWLTFCQLFLSGVVGALFMKIKEAVMAQDVSETHQMQADGFRHVNVSFSTSFFEARRRKHPDYQTLVNTAQCNALGFLCLNIAYVHGSITMVQIIKTLEPLTTYVLSVKLLKMQPNFRSGLSLILVVVGAAYTSWGDATFNGFPLALSLISNIMIAFRNVLVKSQKINSKTISPQDQQQDHLPTDPKDGFKFDMPTGFLMFSLISAIGSVWVGVMAVFVTLTFGASFLPHAATLSNVALSSFFFLCYNSASFVVLSLTDAVTHSFLNICKRFININFNIALFDDGFSEKLVLGLCMNFCGMILYQMSELRSSNSGTLKLIMIPSLIVVCVVLSNIFSSLSLLPDPSYFQKEFSLLFASGPFLQILVIPFTIYVFRNGTTEHLSCKKTIVLVPRNVTKAQEIRHPFTELRVNDITKIGFDTGKNNTEHRRYDGLHDDVLCLQTNFGVGAVAVYHKATFGGYSTLILGSSHTNRVLQALGNDTNHLDYRTKVVSRKTVAVAGWYKPSSPEVRAQRRKDGNSGNFLWQFGATEMMNPWTSKIVDAFNLQIPASQIDALVIASANALLLSKKVMHNYNLMKSHVQHLQHVLKAIGKPTVVLGIGIQAEFQDFSDNNTITLHPHQVLFMNEIQNRSVGKSVAVRGQVTETACLNAGVNICSSMGCPSLTLAHTPNLGQVLKIKWHKVESQLAKKERLKLGVTLPALILGRGHDYERLVDILLSICKGHDCYFILQMSYDRQILKYAKGQIDSKNILHFNEGVEEWFEFMHTLDFVVSTRIHGGMAGIINEIPTVVVPTDFRIMELVDEMKIPHVTMQNAVKHNITSLAELMAVTIKDFKMFEESRRNKIKKYLLMLANVGLELNPALLKITLPEM